MTVNGKAVAFPTDARYVGEEGDVITVQSVNEYGGLSDMSAEVTLQSATAVKAVTSSVNAGIASQGTFGIDGRQYNAPQTGVNIVRMSDGTVKKVLY